MFKPVGGRTSFFTSKVYRYILPGNRLKSLPDPLVFNQRRLPGTVSLVGFSLMRRVCLRTAPLPVSLPWWGHSAKPHVYLLDEFSASGAWLSRRVPHTSLPVSKWSPDIPACPQLLCWVTVLVLCVGYVRTLEVPYGWASDLTFHVSRTPLVPKLFFPHPT